MTSISVNFPAGEPVNGCDDVACRAVCGNCRPRLDPPAIDNPLVDAPATEQVRRVDRRCALLVAAAAVVAGAGYGTGRALRPYQPLVGDALMLLVLSLILFGLLLMGAGALLAWRWWTGRADGGDR